LQQDIQNYSVLKLMPNAGEILKGQKRLQLAAPRHQLASSNRGSRKQDKANLSAGELQDFEGLRQLRKEIADSEERPAYQVFGDAVLIEMVQKRPQTESALLAINGVGEQKLARYGFEFLHYLKQLDKA